jgi:arsenate reductase
MITIYHNARCSKSRECLKILDEHTKDYKVVNYLQNPISEKELRHIISLLKIAPIELIRKKESIWTEEYKSETLSDDEVIAAVLKHPKLMERPIVIHGKKAMIGRPPLCVLEIL